MAFLMDIGRNTDIYNWIPTDQLDLRDGVLVREMTDGTGRSFAFVAFRSKNDPTFGFTIVMEYCPDRLGEYTPSFGGYGPVQAEEEMFMATSNDPTADYPGKCDHGL